MVCGNNNKKATQLHMEKYIYKKKAMQQNMYGLAATYGKNNYELHELV